MALSIDHIYGAAVADIRGSIQYAHSVLGRGDKDFPQNASKSEA